MKMILLKQVAAIFLFFALMPVAARSQDLSGIWRGYFITDNGQNYRLEFQVDQSKTATVNGVSYSYLPSLFYGKATMTGKYTRSEKKFIIYEIKTVEVKNLGMGGTCLMKYQFTYSRSGKEEFLEGTYVGKSEDRLNPENNGKWGDCGGGKVFLRRVTTSDFYVEPFVRNKTANLPKEKTPAKTTPEPKRTAPQKPAVTKKENITQKPDTVTRRKNEPVIIEKPVDKPLITLPALTRSRSNELTHTFTVSSEEVLIKLYDNGEIDDDTISLYLDGQLILSNMRLSATPITYTLKLDQKNSDHVLVMVAENLGRIPPNTALMIVQDGNNRYQANITSTEQKNAMVRFRYQPK